MKSSRRRTVVSLFTGSAGLDLGFEAGGFGLAEGIEIDPWCVRTCRLNRPDWPLIEGDVREYEPTVAAGPDVLLAGPPCQGFSLGGNRRAGDGRNALYQQVLRVARSLRPRAVVIENVLNLRTMREPETGHNYAEVIAGGLRRIGYDVRYGIFRMSKYGVPQTRRRFVFVGFKGSAPQGYHLPTPGGETTIRPFLHDLAQQVDGANLPNHQPAWGFRSAVHTETGAAFDPESEVVPVRFSRTASDGHPVRPFDKPFPAVDTATVWGWAQGDVRARRVEKDRKRGRFVRNPEADVTLWRVEASRLRTFTHREYARLQTFPDDWTFLGDNKRSVHLQIGNAVPVEFARRLAENVAEGLNALDVGREFRADPKVAMTLF